MLAAAGPIRVNHIISKAILSQASLFFNGFLWIFPEMIIKIRNNMGALQYEFLRCLL